VSVPLQQPREGGRQIAVAALEQALLQRAEAVVAYLNSSSVYLKFEHEHLHRAVQSYLKRSAKRLRPAVLLLSTGAVGGDESVALPAAAGVELFHTWTLVHDDLIDNDGLRRGGPTVHEEFRRAAIESGGYSPQEAEKYGRDIAILAGDIQHGWAVSLFAEIATGNAVSPQVALSLIHILESQVVSDIARGEALDVQYSARPLGEVALEEVLLMLRLKTGALYEFAAKAGAMIGLNSADVGDPQVQALAEFGRLCGTAFQLQDDILGIVGDEKSLGKPVGSDIREGKRTTIVHYAFNNAGRVEKDKLSKILGNRQARGSEVAEAKELLLHLGGVAQTERLAKEWLEKGLHSLEVLPASEQRELLASVAHYMIMRSV
jgi:geranylgeranyl diphosphate synthase type I